ncbi:hypothetical protein CO038_04485 [Candidatus Pacearchaeota archaeon CG_4_9_14_0_2_um_filter_39_13]|nr:ATP-dependent helicase [Candidatus Pacearchaeota archaeon]OIO42584.1 MAG: hypothetical protein AUJ64_03825 [Candidatus Pacearchaeota archaeon CG1_02_39_14]PJC44326.1 MAG: hypothetical protein CO038_04485 [Candidatus Pacearchaeota archaeon CG_4_9_14_0_2_um_filter_39_13]
MSSVIKKTKGPCAILAGAGTGKTYAIVEKVRYILQNKIYPPEKIVCLTFSNEAANALRSRILGILKDDREPAVKTFHSFCADLLRKYGEKIGINPDFKILLPEDAKIILHKNFKIQPYYCHKYTATISTAKDLGISIQDLQEYIDKNPHEDLDKKIEDLQFKLKTFYLKDYDREEKRSLSDTLEKLEKINNLSKFVKAWRAYEKIKAARNMQDYSDLNSKAIILLEKHPEIALEYKYVIVDEFQDTNKLQFDFLKLLAPEKNITVVGDLNQSIYRFRGAYKENFNIFRQYFQTGDSDIFTLAKSFRSPNSVLKTAHKLIENNYSNKQECFFVENAHNRPGEKIEAYELKNAKEETRKIIEIINKELKKGTPEDEICVLFRTHQQSRLLKKSLEYQNINYTAVASRSLFKSPEIKKVLDYLRILDSIRNNKKGSDNPWWDLFHSSGFSEEDLLRLGKFLKDNRDMNNLGQLVLDEDINLSEQGKIKLGLITKRIKSLLPPEENLPKLILRIYETLGLDPEQDKESMLCMHKFHELVQKYSQIESHNLGDFLHHIQIMENLGIEIEAPSAKESGIRIMTQHATKGLEYKAVIVSNLAQKRFPMERINSNSLIPAEISPELKPLLSEVPEAEKDYIIKEYETANQLLEERRLCYVAFTRAKENLYLTYALDYGNKKHYPSQFLNEIDYKKNPEISFVQDLDDRYEEPKLSIKPAASEISKESPKIKFSPSSLLLFDECQKKYEYKYIYNMPEPKPVSWEAIKLGSFVHHVIELGIKNNYRTENEFILLAKSEQAEEEWDFIELDEALPLIKVFFERNRNKYNSSSKTEINLSANISGLNFIGYADRVDFTPSGVEIIDYKTGNSYIQPKARNWQLGFYALAAQEKYGKVYKLTLDMLKKEKPLEFILDEKGNATESGGRMSFNLHEVKEELVSTAQAILGCYKTGFKPCPIEKNCDFCNEYVWGL